MNEPFFPFTIHAYETPHFTSSSYHFRETFLANKPARMGWYAYDVIVKSQTRVEFVVYDMENMCSGGIGKKIGAFEADVKPAVTRPFIEAHAERLARKKRERELIAHEEAIVTSYKNEILQSIGPKRRKM